MGSISNVAELIPAEYRAPQLSERDKLIRKAFVKEYLRCGSEFNALIRIGYDAAYVEDVLKNFQREPFTQCILQEAREENIEIERQVAMINNSANQLNAIAGSVFVPSQQRITAAQTLAKMFGADTPNSSNGKDLNEVQGGVMMVPAMTSADEWEKLSSASQKKLKADVRE